MTAEKKTAKSAEKNKKNFRTEDIVTLYAILTSLKISTLDKIGKFTVIRAARALKPVDKAFKDFAKDAQERLRPENFDDLVEKNERLDELTPAEQKEAKKAMDTYNKAVEECVSPELDKMREIETFKGFSQDLISKISSENPDLRVGAIMLLEDICGHD